MSGCNLTCRGVHFSGLTGALGEMGCRQVVPSELATRSYVHYWRTRRKPLPFHRAAVCAKAKHTRWHVLTFGSHAEHKYKAKEYICRPARTLGADTCRAADLSDVHNASSQRWMEQHSINLQTRGLGYWKWKPLLIQQALRRLPRDDVLIWIDRDLRLFNRPLNMLFCLGQNMRKGVATFHYPCFLERKWTKRELADAMGASREMMETVQIMSNLIVLRKTSFAAAFLKEWLEWMVARNDTTSLSFHSSPKPKELNPFQCRQLLMTLETYGAGRLAFVIEQWQCRCREDL
ncbi:MAG: hypothetical protein SGPRY_005368 [Prymnesium sp.]